MTPRSRTSLLSLLFVCLFAVTFVGCGGKSDPNANVTPDQIAPDPEKLGEDPEYAKQMGGE